MGHKLGKLFTGKLLNIRDVLKSKTVVIDGYLYLYKFLAVYRNKKTGDCFKNSRGMITSHLYGLTKLITNLYQYCDKIIYVLEGVPPELKKETLMKRSKRKAESRELLNYLESTGLEDEKLKYRLKTSSTYITQDILESTKHLLKNLGVCVVHAPEEGEAYCVNLYKQGYADFIISNDWDITLFDIPHIFRNITIGENEVTGYLYDINMQLKALGLTHGQFVMATILSGTDYWDGIFAVGPKTAINIVKTYGENIDEYPDTHKTYDLTEFKLRYKQIVNYLHKHVECKPPKYPESNLQELNSYLIDICEFSLPFVMKCLEILKR